jgi:hypothetical protein
MSNERPNDYSFSSIFRLVVLLLTWTALPISMAVASREPEAALLVFVLPLGWWAIFPEGWNLNPVLVLIIGWLVYLIVSVPFVLVPKRSVAFVLYALLLTMFCFNVQGCRDLGKAVQGVRG